MKLVVNGTAVACTSLGGRRYYYGIKSNLTWLGGIEEKHIGAPSAWGRLKELAYLGAPDEIFWTPAQRGPLFARNHVVTVLDCINVEYTYRDDRRLALYRGLFERILRSARTIVAISNSTRDAIYRNYELGSRQVHVIPGPNWFPEGITATDSPRASLDPGGNEDARFVLMFSNELVHKNTLRATQAFARSLAARQGIELRVVGRLPDGAIEACRSAGACLSVRRFVDDSTLNAWLQRCDYLLSPSLDEGLNLPIGEALSAGARVLCSDITVHREFFDGRVRYFDPLDTDAIVAAMDQAFERPDLWISDATAIPHITFGDVARGYHELFSGIAAS